MSIRDIDSLFESGASKAQTEAFAKISAAHDAARQPEGYNDPVYAARILHSALYDPHTLYTMEFGPLTDQQLMTLLQPYSYYNRPPARDEFVEKTYLTTIMQGTPPDTFHRGARQTVEELHNDEFVQLIPWTQGHVPQQVAKVAALGIGLRNSPAGALVINSPYRKTLFMDGVVAHDKFDETSLDTLRTLTAEQQTIVVEDRYENILRLQQTPGFEATLGLWMVKGQCAATTHRRLSDAPTLSESEQALQRALHTGAIRAIKDPSEIIDGVSAWDVLGVLQPNTPTGVILDFDGTLIDTPRRVKAQHQATLARLLSEQWITAA